MFYYNWAIVVDIVIELCLYKHFFKHVKVQQGNENWLLLGCSYWPAGLHERNIVIGQYSITHEGTASSLSAILHIKVFRKSLVKVEF